MHVNICPKLVVSQHMSPMVRLPPYSASGTLGRWTFCEEILQLFITLQTLRAFHAAMGLVDKVALQAFPQWFGSKVLISKGLPCSQVARGIVSRACLLFNSLLQNEGRTSPLR